MWFMFQLKEYESGSVVRKIREHYNLTQKELGKEINETQSTISKLEVNRISGYRGSELLHKIMYAHPDMPSNFKQLLTAFICYRLSPSQAAKILKYRTDPFEI